MDHNILNALSEITREKSIDKAVIIESLEAGLQSAARKKLGAEANIDAGRRIEVLLQAGNGETAELLRSEAALVGSLVRAVKGHGARLRTGSSGAGVAGEVRQAEYGRCAGYRAAVRYSQYPDHDPLSRRPGGCAAFRGDDGR